MAKKKQIGILGAAAIAMATMTGNVNATQSVQQENVIQQSAKKDAKHEEKKMVRPQAEKNKFGGFSGESNPYKFRRKGDYNQRQKRKLWASNPHLRKKKKG